MNGVKEVRNPVVAFDGNTSPTGHARRGRATERIIMRRKRAEKIEELPPPVETVEETTEKKSRKLDVDALRNYAKGLDEAQADVLTNKIDLFVEADEVKKLASKRLRTTLKAIKTLNGDGEEE
jgi:hypothetical protein